MADKIAVLRAGKLEQFGPPLELFNRPANLFVAGFIGSPKMNFLKAEAKNDQLYLAGGLVLPMPTDAFHAPTGRDCVVGIRPGEVEIVDTASGMLMQVNAVEQLGSESFLFGATETGDALVVTTKGQTSVRSGDTIGVAIDYKAMHVFDGQTSLSLAVETG